MSAPPPAKNATGTATAAARFFGRFQLRRLLGKSDQTMLWLVTDPRTGQDQMLTMPRQQLPDADAVVRWTDQARRATRIDHPGVARAIEVGEHDRWPYITYERGQTVTLAETVGSKGLAAAELVPSFVPALQGLAFSHEGGVAHRDIQLHMLVLATGGGCRLLGLGAAAALAGGVSGASGAQALRTAAERDVLAMGLVLHHALAGRPALEQADTSLVMQRMAPLGHDWVRLPRQDIQAVPAPLRAIVDRSTERQERQRYRSARTMERALAGWLKGGTASGGPLALLVERVRSGGLLPAMPGGAARASQLTAQASKRTDELAEVLLQDVGLAFELLRLANTAGVRGASGAGNGPILTLRRALALMGLDGVSRAARALRPWPGHLADAHQAEFTHQLDLARRAGRVAQWLRPAGYDSELAFLLAMLQRLGRLVTQYHFPEEAAQIRRLQLPAAAPRQGEPDEPGMNEQAASYAVLGVDIDAIGHALAQSWGFDDMALTMMRRHPSDAPVHASERDADLLRATASCANEVVDASALPPTAQATALHHLVQRYARMLHITLDDVRKAARGEPPGSSDDGRPGPGGMDAAPSAPSGSVGA